MIFINKNYNINFGKLGENLACEYLCNLGYKVLDRNYRTKYGEIDIVAVENNKIIFIEVKTRSSQKFGRPCEAVNEYKKRRIISSSRVYLKNKFNTDNIRFDVIEVICNDFQKNIIHLKNVFF